MFESEATRQKRRVASFFISGDTVFMYHGTNATHFR
jgi:hypothetical protein